MGKQDLIERTEKFVQEILEGDSSGHDWWHVHRVRKLAMALGKREGADLLIVELAALLHDVDDWKLIAPGAKGRVGPWLRSLSLVPGVVEAIEQIISQLSFKGAGVDTSMASIEGKVVQDADRLDAMGAIGIARTFAYGGSQGHAIYEPGIKPEMHASFEAYKKSKGHTINHFYEKLLLLKERMQTESGALLARKRHQLMEDYLLHFFQEWDGQIE